MIKKMYIYNKGYKKLIKLIRITLWKKSIYHKNIFITKNIKKTNFVLRNPCRPVPLTAYKPCNIIKNYRLITDKALFSLNCPSKFIPKTFVYRANLPKKGLFTRLMHMFKPTDKIITKPIGGSCGKGIEIYENIKISIDKYI